MPITTHNGTVQQYSRDELLKMKSEAIADLERRYDTLDEALEAYRSWQMSLKVELIVGRLVLATYLLGEDIEPFDR